MAGPQKKSLKQIIQEEYQKCAKDPVHFMRKYCKIQHPQKGKIFFNLYDFQEHLLTDLRDNRFNVILKSRQLGISTLSAGYALWLMTFHEDKNILVVATRQDVAKNLVTKVRVMNENLPSWLKGKCVEDNKLGLKYANGSQIKAVSSSEDATRSEALSLLIIDEAAFIRGIDNIWTSAQSTLSEGGSCIVLSTPNGVGNWFHKTWVDATTNPKTKWNNILLHWTVHPDRDQSWREEQTSLLGVKKASQECDCDFISSGHTVVEGDTLQWYKDTHVIDPVEMRGPMKEFWIWDYPDYSKDYMVIADVARGDGKDFSAFQVIEVESMTQVAEYKGQIGTKEYGNMLVNVATEYNEALLVIENTGVGWAAIQPALDRGYQNLYYTSNSDNYIDPTVQLRKGYDIKDKAKMTPGFTTSSKSRPIVISKIEQVMRERGPIIKSSRLIEELFVFIWNGSKAEAQQGYNDDLVMSFSIGMWVRDTALKLRQQGIDLTRQTLKGFRRNVSLYTDKRTMRKDTGWSQNVRGNDEDLTWLI